MVDVMVAWHYFLRKIRPTYVCLAYHILGFFLFFFEILSLHFTQFLFERLAHRGTFGFFFSGFYTLSTTVCICLIFLLLSSYVFVYLSHVVMFLVLLVLRRVHKPESSTTQTKVFKHHQLRS